MTDVWHLPKRINAVHVRCQPYSLVAGHLQGCCQAFRGHVGVVSRSSMIARVRTQLLAVIVLLLGATPLLV